MSSASPPNPAAPLAQDEMEVSCPATYGNYTLLHRIARGGVGNVYLAKTAGTMGIEKHCVVKMLRARFTHDADYVQRFMDEARVVVQLSHKNIAPVFDVGRVGASYYLAMELVIGRDVRSFMQALAEHKKPLSEGAALHLVCEMLDALDYAHKVADATTGEPLHLVHRDVSPQNVLLNVNGEVKLIDFGLAERGRPLAEEVQHSGATTVMGKMSYMAPEQARGDVVDARADQFSAAIVAYELLRSGDRYYAGLTSQQVWQQAGAGTFRPAGIQKLEPSVRAVLERALETDREHRFITCGAFRDALREVISERGLLGGEREVRALAQEMFADDLKNTRDLLRTMASSVANSSATSPTSPSPTSPPPSTLRERSDPRIRAPAVVDRTRIVEDRDVVSIASSGRTVIHDPTEIVNTSVTVTMSPDAAGRPPKPVLVAAGLIGLGLAAAVAIAVWPMLSSSSSSSDPASAATMPQLSTGAAAAGAGAGAGGGATATAPPPAMAPPEAGTALRPGIVDVSVSEAPEPVRASSTKPKGSPKPAGATKPAVTKPPLATTKPPPATTPATPPATTPAPPKQATIAEKFAVLRKCKEPCAAQSLVWDGRMNEIPLADLKEITGAITKCYEKCR